MRISASKGIDCPLIIDDQIIRYHTLLPFIKKKLIDSMPSYAWDYINKKSVEEIVADLHEDDYGRKCFPLMNFIALGLWDSFVQSTFV